MIGKVLGAWGTGKEFAVRTEPSITRSGLHTVNKLLTVLLLRVPMCRASVGWRFRNDKVVRSSYSKTQIMPYYVMFNRHVHDITSVVRTRSNF